MLTDKQREKKLALIKQQGQFLIPSFDAVQIFATKHDPETGDTVQFSWGIGNWWARYGHVASWINSENHDIATGKDQT